MASISSEEKQGSDNSVHEAKNVESTVLSVHDETTYNGLTRRLNTRHIFMITIGTSIGMGLWLGSGSTLYQGGPASVWIGYWLACFIGWALNQAMGELAVLYPVPSAFPQWTRHLIDPSLALSLGWISWLSSIIGIPNEVAGLITVIDYWDDRVNPAVWITVFLVVIVLFNIFAVNIFAEVETVFSTIKFCWIFVVIIASIVISAGGGPSHKSTGFHYWKTTPFKHGFKGFLAVMPNSVFTISGIEMAGMVAAEARHPKVSIPRSVQTIWIRLGLFYILGSLMVTILVDPNNENLFGASGTNASPFVIGFVNGGLPGLAHAQNAVILISVFSSGNTALYSGPRTLMGLAEIGMAPKIFLKTDKHGKPWVGFLLTLIIGGGLSYLNVSNSGATVFGWLSNLVSLQILFLWSLIFISSLRMRAAWKAQGRSLSDLPWKSTFAGYTSWLGLCLCIILIVVEFYLAVWPLGKPTTANNFFATYVSVIVIIVIYAIAKCFYRGPPLIKASNIDLDKIRRFYGPEDDVPEPDFFSETWAYLKRVLSHKKYSQKEQ